jgi:hypothetical protein
VAAAMICSEDGTMKKLLLVALIVGCGGGGSGVDGGKAVGTLTAADVMSLCTYFFDTYPLRNVTCSTTDTRTIGEKSVTDCVTALQKSVTDNPQCAATVSQAEDCLGSEYGMTDSQICTAQSIPPECAPLEAANCNN